VTRSVSPRSSAASWEGKITAPEGGIPGEGGGKAERSVWGRERDAFKVGIIPSILWCFGVLMEGGKEELSYGVERRKRRGGGGVLLRGITRRHQ